MIRNQKNPEVEPVPVIPVIPNPQPEVSPKPEEPRREQPGPEIDPRPKPEIKPGKETE